MFTGKVSLIAPSASFRPRWNLRFCVTPKTPRYQRQVIDYHGPRRPQAMSLIDTPERLLYLIQSDGRRCRSGIGV